MPAYVTEVVELTDSNPTVTTGLKPRSVTVLVRQGSAQVMTGPLAQAGGKGSFVVSEGETWSWSIDEAIDWVEQATVTANPGSIVQVMWQRF